MGRTRTPCSSKDASRSRAAAEIKRLRDAALLDEDGTALRAALAQVAPAALVAA